MQNVPPERTAPGSPLLGVLGDHGSSPDRYVRLARHMGWRCVILSALPDPGTPFALLVARSGAVPAVSPLLRLTTGLAVVGEGEGEQRVDDVVPAAIDDVAVRDLLARWRPLPLPAATRRQVDTFGNAAVGPLLAGLRDRLADALDAVPVIARRSAHQVAGLAGLLGFADVASAWEAYSADGDSHRLTARRAARRALTTLEEADLSHWND